MLTQVGGAVRSATGTLQAKVAPEPFEFRETSPFSSSEYRRPTVARSSSVRPYVAWA
jgi:hypothetical protein